MADLVECPFCKVKVGERRLSRHVVEQHLDKGPVDGPLPKWEFAYHCWCGVMLPSRFASHQHVEKNGGVIAHYLACQLGESHES